MDSAMRVPEVQLTVVPGATGLHGCFEFLCGKDQS